MQRSGIEYDRGDHQGIGIICHANRPALLGVQISCDQATLVIDLLEEVAPIRSLLGDPRLPVVSGPEAVDVALITHLHPDHYDAESLRKKLRPEVSY